MFIENSNLNGGRQGSIEIITGSMFSGKTEELIRRLKRVRIANQTAEIFKPSLDIRNSHDKVTSHDDNVIDSTAVSHSSEIVLLINNAQVVGIDEAQFFDIGLVSVCNTLANNGIRVIVAGLDMDYLGKPFGPIPQLLAIADFITKVHAICVRCGNLAQFSHRITSDDRLVVLGSGKNYEPLCRECYKMTIYKTISNI